MDTKVMLSILIGGVAAVVIAILLILRCSGSSSFRSGTRQGYQDVIIRDAVDVKTQRYIADVNDFYQGESDRQATSLTNERMDRWNIVFQDVKTGRQYRFGFSGSMTIGRVPAGRGQEIRFVLKDDAKVSHVHCKIGSSGRDGRLILQDLGSRNGTSHNGKKIKGAVRLSTGDEIRIGDSVFRIQFFRGQSK